MTIEKPKLKQPQSHQACFQGLSSPHAKGEMKDPGSEVEPITSTSYTTIFSQPWTNKIHGAIYLFSQTNEEQAKVKPITSATLKTSWADTNQN